MLSSFFLFIAPLIGLILFPRGHGKRIAEIPKVSATFTESRYERAYPRASFVLFELLGRRVQPYKKDEKEEFIDAQKNRRKREERLMRCKG